VGKINGWSEQRAVKQGTAEHGVQHRIGYDAAEPGQDTAALRHDLDGQESKLGDRRADEKSPHWP
jgi:hypothetical protein